jgi:hypothetical protein
LPLRRGIGEGTVAAEEAEAEEVSLGVEARAADSAAPAPGLLAGRDKITGARLAACPGEVVADAALAGACVGKRET